MRKITSIEKYVSEIMKMKEDEEDKGIDSSYQWFFRGQKDSSWSIMPNAFRKDKLRNEYAVIQNAIRQNPFEFRNLTEFEVLTKLQHYGLGTRLLDVTLNPFVALYFATEPAITYEKGKDNRFKQVEKDGAIFYKHAQWCSLSDIGAHIASAIPFIQFDNTITLNRLLEQLAQDNFIPETQCESLKRDNYAAFVEYIQKSYFIISTHSNERLIRQSGAFVLPTAVKINGTITKNGDNNIQKAYSDLSNEFDKDYFVIPYKDKSKIREELDLFNINEATLFPELEHQMTYIQRKNNTSSYETAQFQLYKPQEICESIKEYNDLSPDVEKIINAVILDDLPDLKHKLIIKITEEIRFVDWKSKQQIRSKVISLIRRELQKYYTVTKRDVLSDRIFDLLLSPSPEYIKSCE